MPSLTIKRISNDLLERLRNSAEANQRSLNSEVLYRLKQSAADSPLSAGRLIAEIRAFNAENPLPRLDDEFLARARSDGRP